jgi:hypothetical protein
MKVSAERLVAALGFAGFVIASCTDRVAQEPVGYRGYDAAVVDSSFVDWDAFALPPLPDASGAVPSLACSGDGGTSDAGDDLDASDAEPDGGECPRVTRCLDAAHTIEYAPGSCQFGQCVYSAATVSACLSYCSCVSAGPRAASCRCPIPI